jgi:hypothetical protein
MLHGMHAAWYASGLSCMMTATPIKATAALEQLQATLCGSKQNTAG